ncbi:hypothetical protein B296_00003643 [Ensete ventricosum]|uniref:SUI1 domain-containing protein n=1 Tax=Ensete ventricosum TaxID=4639 RepID=A0A427A2S9_ENSVE|nr:hypothetical protein B296_00003643 [Ensete ventricosum]
MGFARAVSANPFPFHLGPVNSMPEEDRGTRKRKAQDLQKVAIKETKDSLQPISVFDLKNKLPATVTGHPRGRVEGRRCCPRHRSIKKASHAQTLYEEASEEDGFLHCRALLSFRAPPLKVFASLLERSFVGYEKFLLSEVDCPSLRYPFAEANADDSGAGAKEYVHVRVQQRNGRKSLTTVQGLNKEFSYNKILKDLKKEFCCNGTVVQDPELGQVHH